MKLSEIEHKKAQLDSIFSDRISAKQAVREAKEISNSLVDECLKLHAQCAAMREALEEANDLAHKFYPNAKKLGVKFQFHVGDNAGVELLERLKANTGVNFLEMRECLLIAYHALDEVRDAKLRERLKSAAMGYDRKIRDGQCFHEYGPTCDNCKE